MNIFLCLLICFLQAITREALRREVRRLFLEDPPAEIEGVFELPEDATLTELYRAYYGKDSSPTRFYKVSTF